MKNELLWLLTLPVIGLLAVPLLSGMGLVGRPQSLKTTNLPAPLPVSTSAPIIEGNFENTSKLPELLTTILGPRQVADLLDAVVQPLFMDDAGVFGTDRFYSPIKGHEELLPQSDELVREFYFNNATATLLKKTRTARWGFMVGFLHTTHIPGKPILHEAGEYILKINPNYLSGKSVYLSPLATYNSKKFPVLTHLNAPPYKPEEGDSEDSASKDYEQKMKEAYSRTKPIVKQWEKTAIARWKPGKNIDVAQGDWRLFLRPVKAGKASCVSCHAGAKVGDTLGVMVYAVKNSL